MKYKITVTDYVEIDDVEELSDAIAHLLDLWTRPTGPHRVEANLLDPDAEDYNVFDDPDVFDQES